MTREERRLYNISVFNDTKFIISKSDELKKSIQDSITNTKLYAEKDTIDIGEPLEKKGNVYVTQNSSFDAARMYIEGKTAVLNFASATTPGGGVTKGSTAQEECLCRASTLYDVIKSEKCWDMYYKVNRDNLNALHTDDIIWSPNIKIIKSDDYQPLDNYVTVDVITCAAPNLREKNVDIFNVDKPLSYKVSNEQLFDIHYKRASKIFKAAIDNKIDNIIVGAFGCGAFQNDPKVVAEAWKKASDEYRKYFDNIEFAVYCKSYNIENYNTFKKIIKTA